MKKKMVNVAFYFDNGRIKDVDCRSIRNGNPGIGGAYYAMLMLVTKLGVNNGKYKFKLLANNTKYISTEGLDVVSIPDLLSLKGYLLDEKIEILVVNKLGRYTVGKDLFRMLCGVDVKVIIWAHCYIPLDELNFYSKQPKVRRIVCVSKEQLHTFRDHPAFRKATYNYNICDFRERKLIPYSNRKNWVVYIGSLVPLKGVHLLTDVWTKVLEKVPDAQLFIIGGGNLYDRNAKMGPYNIAEFFYEQKILRNILKKDGTIIDSVHFMGIMGKEKSELLKYAKVGVPNPSGKTETFGYTAIEMQLEGVRVTTKKCSGYIETVSGNSSLLYSNIEDLSENIIKLLRCDKIPIDCTDSIRHKFDTSTIISRWITIFDQVFNNISPEFIPADSIFLCNKLREYNRVLRQFFIFLPPIMLYEMLINYLVYFFTKLFDIRNTLLKIYYRKMRN